MTNQRPVSGSRDPPRPIRGQCPELNLARSEEAWHRYRGGARIQVTSPGEPGAFPEDVSAVDNNVEECMKQSCRIYIGI